MTIGCARRPGVTHTALRHTFAIALASSTTLLTGLLLLAATGPRMINAAYESDADYAQFDAGHVFGIAALVISAISLGTISVALVAHNRQLKEARRDSLYQRIDELKRRALDEPEYMKCWGPSMAPNPNHERFFYYCDDLIQTWRGGWEIGELPEETLRRYLDKFFDSAIPRQYWDIYGTWHIATRARSRKATFLAIVDEEFLKAQRRGLPTRPYE